MSQFSDEMADVAEDIITEFGESCAFVRGNLGEYDPETGEITMFEDLEYSGYIVTSEFKESEIDGTLIQRDDIKVLSHRMTDIPKIGDRLTFNETSCTIVNVKKTKVNGQSVLYTLQVRV